MCLTNKDYRNISCGCRRGKYGNYCTSDVYNLLPTNTTTFSACEIYGSFLQSMLIDEGIYDKDFSNALNAKPRIF